MTVAARRRMRHVLAHVQQLEVQPTGGTAARVGGKMKRVDGESSLDYDAIQKKYDDFRTVRLRTDTTEQFTSDLAKLDKIVPSRAPWVAETDGARAPINDTVDVLVIGSGFSGIFSSARIREKWDDCRIRMVDRGSDVGGTWYWNRYPGAECDVLSYDYLPLLDEIDYIPLKRYSDSYEIYNHCKKLTEFYRLYDLAVFHTTVSSTVWDEKEALWHIGTDRGDDMKAKFVVVGNGTLSKPKLPAQLIDGVQKFKDAGHTAFHTSRWDHEFTSSPGTRDLSKLAGLKVGIIGTGATAVQVIPEVAKTAGHLYVFQRTPSTVSVRADKPTDPNWARRLEPGWQQARTDKAYRAMNSPKQQERRKKLTQEQRAKLGEQANMRAIYRLHQRIDQDVQNKEVAEALKPWYHMGCKRPCFHDYYLTTYNRPNVTLVDTKGKGVDGVTANGAVFEGKEYPLDLLLLATGFEVQVTGIYNQIKGIGGEEIQEKYGRMGISTLLGIHSNNYPNMYVMVGYQAAVSFNFTEVISKQAAHIADCIDFARTKAGPSKVLHVKTEKEKWWVDKCIENRGKTNYSENCTPGYYNFEGQTDRPRQNGVYGGGQIEYNEQMVNVSNAIPEFFDMA